VETADERQEKTGEETGEETPMKDTRVLRRDFVTGSGLAAFGGLLASRAAPAAELNALEAANLEVVREFCASWSTLDLQRVTAHMTADAVYRMTETAPPVTGAAALIAQMQPWVDTSSAIEFRILESFAKGPLVVNHRVDRFSSTTRPLTWEGVGVFLVQDGKIKEWFDYTIGVQRG
jgi:limonene-1,2-epoxide hydrolase